ncbi:MAG TPA: PilZ domain-containing protein [Nevskiaceae bacterium]|nr:PilZ domain-containing protein [Nevskiaceae bacterium]
MTPLKVIQTLPLAWQGDARAGEDPAWGDEALRLLDIAHSLQQRRHLAEEPAPLDVEIQRLHDKLDLVLECMARLLPAELPLRRQAVELAVEALAWNERVEAGPGWVHLQLHPALPQPLRLPGQAQPVEAGVRVLLEPTRWPPPLQQAWHQQVFLQHRRALARRRGS